MNVYVLLCLAAVAVVGLIEWVKNLVEKFLTVPGFSGVRIHSGNTAEDTEGCILVGFNRLKGKVLDSRKTFQKLFKILIVAVRGGENLEIEIN